MKFKKPRKPSECTVQAHLYFMCKELELDCYLEYTHKNCQFDIVVVVDQDIVAIIETKSVPEYKLIDKRKEIVRNLKLTEQLKKYSVFGVPVLLCLSLMDTGKTMMRVNKLVAEHPFSKKKLELANKFHDQVEELYLEFRFIFPDALVTKSDILEFKGSLVTYLQKTSYSEIDIAIHALPQRGTPKEEAEAMLVSKGYATFKDIPPQLLFWKKMNNLVKGHRLTAKPGFDSFKTFGGRYLPQGQFGRSERKKED